MRSSMMQRVRHETAWFRLLLSRKVQRRLLGPVSGALPYSFIKNIEESAYKQEVEAHLESVHCVAPAMVQEYHMPASFPYWFRRRKAFDEKKLYVLKQVIMSPHSGLVWCDGGVLFGESIGDLYRLTGWAECLHEPLVSPVKLNQDDPVVCCPNALYYHWLLEVLPNILYALELFPCVKIIVGENAQSFVMEGLELVLGVAVCEQKVLRCSERFPLLVEQVVLTSLDDWSGYIRTEDVTRVRRAFSHVTDQQNTASTGTHIYVSRSQSYRRSLPNEKQLEQLLQNAGFDIIQPEKMSLKDQIAAFSHAEIIVSPHGAGLSNMIWRTGVCSIVEVFTPAWLNDCYARLAVQLGFSYRYIFLEDGMSVTELAHRISEPWSAGTTRTRGGTAL
ncbi:MAG: glycosyltransferase family 61 protein [Spartobacteria bacterium]|nr:glycosyltransferase family 61 protein [Spartobacteria bacterium]